MERKFHFQLASLSLCCVFLFLFTERATVTVVVTITVLCVETVTIANDIWCILGIELKQRTSTVRYRERDMDAVSEQTAATLPVVRTEGREEIRIPAECCDGPALNR